MVCLMTYWRKSSSTLGSSPVGSKLGQGCKNEKLKHAQFFRGHVLFFSRALSLSRSFFFFNFDLITSPKSLICSYMLQNPQWCLTFVPLLVFGRKRWTKKVMKSKSDLLKKKKKKSRQRLGLARETYRKLQVEVYERMKTEGAFN